MQRLRDQIQEGTEKSERRGGHVSVSGGSRRRNGIGARVRPPPQQFMVRTLSEPEDDG